MPTSDREAVLVLFERHRQSPGEPFDESHFLDHLLAHPKGERAVYNSFAGLRRFNAFIDTVQLEFSICFSVKDRDANYSVQEFVQRIGELKASRRSCLASLRNQQRRGFGWGTVALLNLLGLVACTLALRFFQPLGALLAALLMLANLMLVRFYFRERAYGKRLAAQIQESEGDT